MRLFHRSFSRADIPVKYSEGFNPHPRFSIANPLSLGIESEEEYMDIDLNEIIPVETFIDRMNNVLPPDIQILEGKYLKKQESLSSIIAWAYYEIGFDTTNEVNLDVLSNKVHEWLNNEEIFIERLRKKGKQKVMKKENIRPLIGNVIIKGMENGDIAMEALLKSGDSGNLRPMDFVKAFIEDNSLSIDINSVSIKRLGLYAEDKGSIFKPL